MNIHECFLLYMVKILISYFISMSAILINFSCCNTLKLLALLKLLEDVIAKKKEKRLIFTLMCFSVEILYISMKEFSRPDFLSWRDLQIR